MGGLGNQLFQIFTTINYSILTKNPFKFLDIKILESGITKRQTYWDTFLNKFRPFLIVSLPDKIQIIKEKNFYYYDIKLTDLTYKDIYLHGYFQSYKYFEKNFEIICKLLNINEKKTILKNKLYNYNFDESLSIHFRLGDYKNLQDYHPILPYEYYKNSIDYILKNDNNIKKILYFCEDDDNEDVNIIIDRLKNEFNFNDNFIMRMNNNLQDWEQLLVMSCCKHNIIANSTFSWWGAYLNQYTHKIICYPFIWFGTKANYDTKDLFPDKWIKIYF